MKVFKISYAPLYFMGFVVGAAMLVLSDMSPLWLIGLLIAAISLSLGAERIAPFEAEWNRGHGDAKRDLAHGVVNECSILILVLLLPFFASLVPWSSLWPTALPIWGQIVLAFLLLDAGISLAHFASHRVPLLWRFHAVHHSVRRMYGFNGLLKHPVHQLIEISVWTLPWLLLGIPQDVAIIGSFAVAIQLQLQHSNVDMRVGPLAYLWAVAPVHRHHHLASETDGDVNFGLFLTVWDVLLGTAQFRSSGHIRTGQVGIAGRSDYPEAYLAQLTEPFNGALQRSGSRKWLVGVAHEWAQPMTDTQTYTPPAGHHCLTPFYDIGVRLSTREMVWRRALVELISPKDTDILLDIGAGTGSLASFLAQKNAATRYFGIDPDQHATDIARTKANRAGINAQFANRFFSAAAVADWPAPSAATLCLVLHQVPLDEKLRLLRESHFVLQTGGRLYIADYGEQRSRLMRKLFRATIQKLDGLADTQPNADGVLVPLMIEAGLSDVREIKQLNTVTGSISILCGVKRGDGV